MIEAYKSANLLFQGDVYLTKIEIGTPGNSVTANVPVLDASQQRCADPSQSCTLASSWRFVGVGFGEADAGSTAWPINGTQPNPLFNITAINGVSANPTQGLIMASDGITVGLTQPTPRASIAAVPLFAQAPHSLGKPLPARHQGHSAARSWWIAASATRRWC